MFYKEIINVSDTLWVVQRKIRISDNPIVETWREHLRSDGVFKKDSYFYFCKQITDVYPIDDNPLVEIPSGSQNTSA